MKYNWRKLGMDELILSTDYHSLDDGLTKMPVVNPETVGQTPSQFSKDRTFWRMTVEDDTLKPWWKK